MSIEGRLFLFHLDSDQELVTISENDVTRGLAHRAHL